MYRAKYLDDAGRVIGTYTFDSKTRTPKTLEEEARLALADASLDERGFNGIVGGEQFRKGVVDKLVIVPLRSVRVYEEQDEVLVNEHVGHY